MTPAASEAVAELHRLARAPAGAGRARMAKAIAIRMPGQLARAAITASGASRLASRRAVVEVDAGGFLERRERWWRTLFHQGWG